MTYGCETIGETDEPLLAAARYLLAKRLAQPGDMLSTYRKGVRSMSANVGWAAGRTVIEGPSSGPRIGPHRLYVQSGPSSDDVEKVVSDHELALA
ncbi:MAG: hypothetical protein JWM36_2750 [Hyphomicrobiales bacterium]|nr:hypothetical protein [Hyphomicrobiales bacterium]